MSSSRGGAVTVERGARVAQVHDERVELGERRTTELADGPERRLRVGDLARLGLHHHRGDVVADHVVQLAGDRGALLEPGGLAAQLLGLPDEPRVDHERSRRPAPPPMNVARNGARAPSPWNQSESGGAGEAAHPAEPGLRSRVLGDRDEHQRGHGESTAWGRLRGPDSHERRRRARRPGRSTARSAMAATGTRRRPAPGSTKTRVRLDRADAVAMMTEHAAPRPRRRTDQNRVASTCPSRHAASVGDPSAAVAGPAARSVPGYRSARHRGPIRDGPPGGRWST